MGTPHDRGVGNVLTEDGGEVRGIVGEFGLLSGLRAVRVGLLSVWGADRDVKGSVGPSRAEVRTSAGRKSVPGVSPESSASAVQSQD